MPLSIPIDTVCSLYGLEDFDGRFVERPPAVDDVFDVPAFFRDVDFDGDRGFVELLVFGAFFVDFFEAGEVDGDVVVSG